MRQPDSAAHSSMSAFIAEAARAGRDAAAWQSLDLERETDWIITVPRTAREHLAAVVRAGLRPGQPLFDYRRSDFPFTDEALTPISQAVREAQHGRGIALVRGLPRESLDAEAFELLTWAIGLHTGVARPQDRHTRYINAVRDAGVDYRSPTGRGYSSSAELDFHVDGGDIVMLSCFNAAASGGESLCASAVSAWRQMIRERPDLAQTLEQPVAYSRQGEEPPGEAPFFMTPVIGRTETDLFCRWNRNRIRNGQAIAGAPACTAQQLEAMEYFDSILRRPEFMFRMFLEPGDLQILSNFSTLHSRTAFVDHPEPERKRLLYRLWLTPPDGIRLPPSWTVSWGCADPGVVRGGNPGHHHDERCKLFEARQAAELGMRPSA